MLIAALDEANPKCPVVTAIRQHLQELINPPTNEDETEGEEQLYFKFTTCHSEFNSESMFDQYTVDPELNSG